MILVKGQEIHRMGLKVGNLCHILSSAALLSSPLALYCFMLPLWMRYSALIYWLLFGPLIPVKKMGNYNMLVATHIGWSSTAGRWTGGFPLIWCDQDLCPFFKKVHPFLNVHTIKGQKVPAFNQKNTQKRNIVKYENPSDINKMSLTTLFLFRSSVCQLRALTRDTAILTGVCIHPWT